MGDMSTKTIDRSKSVISFLQKQKLIDYINYLLVNDDKLQEQGKQTITTLKYILTILEPNVDNCYYFFKEDVPIHIFDNDSCMRLVIEILRLKSWDIMYANGVVGNFVLIPPGEVSKFIASGLSEW